MIEHLGTILATVAVFLHWGIIIGLGARIILKRRSTGVSLAWLLLITTLPYVGAFIYLLVGEIWLPSRRIKRAKASRAVLAEAIGRIEDQWELSDDQLSPLARGLNAHAQAPFGLTALGGNDFQICEDCDSFTQLLIEDIDQATQCVHMLFFIWQSAGEIERVESALVRAVERGVRCRLLLDSAGCRDFLSSKRASQLRTAGIEIVEALPAGLLRVFFKRIDIRNHRKIISIDNTIGYTGSMNMVDPRYFKVKRGVGQWVDVMARVRGPAARVLGMNLAMDWAIERVREGYEPTAGPVETIRDAPPIEKAGDIIAQVLPSGPDQGEQLIHEMLLTLIYNTRRRLVITTPYFVPSDAMLQALVSAAHRGVRVTLVLPQRIDSLLVRQACRAYLQDVLEAGVEVFAYKGGLLHAKTVTADDEVGLLGSVNMDLRSFAINFEISLLLYDKGVVGQMRELQKSYIEGSNRIEASEWSDRPVYRRLVENAVQLLSPIL